MHIEASALASSRTMSKTLTSSCVWQANVNHKVVRQAVWAYGSLVAGTCPGLTSLRTMPVLVELLQEVCSCLVV